MNFTDILNHFPQSGYSLSGQVLVLDPVGLI